MALCACDDEATNRPSADAANVDGNNFVPDGSARLDTAADGASSDVPAADVADTQAAPDGAGASGPMVRSWSASSGVLPQAACPPWE